MQKKNITAAVQNKAIFFRQAAWIKPAIIFVMMLVLLIPLGFIRSLVSDRIEYQREAEASIMEPVGGEPVLEGLVLAVPYDTYVEDTDPDGKVIKKGKKTDYIIAVPESYALEMQINPYHLSRGIFTVPIFNGDAAVHAVFSKFQFEHFNIEEKNIRYKDAVLILGIRNKKTLTASPTLCGNGEPLREALTEPAGASPFRHAVYYALPEALVRSGFSLTGSLAVQGGNSLCIMPLAVDNSFNVRSSWTTPSFSGGWLPQNRSIDESGFSADWRISGLSTEFPRSWKAQDFKPAQTDGNDDDYRYRRRASFCSDSTPEAVKIGFIAPINHYSQVTRCITYALLFLAVPFLAIFLCELWSAVQIHPVQYFLIGIADILFYLLLLSFSEHISFNVSYACATAGVCTVVGCYTAAIFRQMCWGVLLAAVHAISYILLFGILQSTDYALLIGSIGLFCVIALLMFLTRRVDWYSTHVTLVHFHHDDADTVTGSSTEETK